MQALGLSDSTPRSESRLNSLFWPSIQSGADVDYLAVQGFWVCTIVGLLALLFFTLAGQPISALLIFILFHRGWGSGTQPIRGGGSVGLLFDRLPSLAGHCVFQDHRHRAAIVKPPCHLDCRQLEARLRRSRTSATACRHVLRQTLRQVAGLYLAEGESALLHLLSRMPRDHHCGAHSRCRSEPSFLNECESVRGPASYFPMQNVLKIRLRMSSVVVAPVMASRGRSAL